VVTEPDRPLVVLLPSPLLGPAVWAPVADELRRRGRDVLVPPAYDEVADPADVLDHLRRSIPAGVPVALVPHSNAGLYAAALAAEREVVAIVYVDAGLPSGEPTTPTAPDRFRDTLSALVEPDGLLPVWTRWWPEDEIAALFPDATTRGVVEAEQQRVPLRYFDGVVPSAPGWAGLPVAYLAFGNTYERERTEAERRGWPVQTLSGGHLHLLVDPGAVAQALLELLDGPA
jgi:pimeloyl-ACP methyl ester carboxylesterase